MGECLITRRGGEVKKIPVLNSSYPEDTTVSVTDENAKTVYFTVDISEQGNPHIYTYKWFVDGVVVEEATESTYVRDVSKDKGQLQVWCEVTNKAGTVRTRTATLTVNRLPVLDASYPADASAIVTKTAEFKVTVSEDGYPANYTYQWYVNDKLVEGATEASFTRTGAAAGTEKIHCVITNEAGSVLSRVATFEVNPEYLFQNGVFATGLALSGSGQNESSLISIDGNCIYVSAHAYGATVAQLEGKVDFTGKNRLVFEASKMHNQADTAVGMWHFGVSDTVASAYGDTPDLIASVIIAAHDSDVKQCFVVDVSAINGYHYVKWGCVREAYNWDDCWLSAIYFE